MEDSMEQQGKPMSRHLHRGRLFGAMLLAALALPGPARAGGSGDLAVVPPVRSCAALASTALAAAVGAAATLETALLDTPKGQFCRVTGTIAPAIGFEVDLPIAGWTQRFLQAGCGGLCGGVHVAIDDAGKCQPALDGAFVVASSDLGHRGRMGGPDEGAFAADPQKRIDFAYRANHVTALAAKALIRAFYGQAPRRSYFSGCSDGGREALMEAERFPDDFDGISAGAPAMLFQAQNAFWHSWTAQANTRPDGTHILLADKLPALHAAVIVHCDALDGTRDGLLADPRACRPDPAWVRCPEKAGDASACLTDEEWAVAAKIYGGPVDGEGRRLLPGGAEPGSEMQWGAFVPADPRGRQMSAGMAAAMAPVVLPDASASDAEAFHVPFTADEVARAAVLHPLNDATDTDLGAFAARGGKLILWHGWSDSSIPSMTSVAFYEAVRRQLGLEAADRFLRLFMIPGVGHCGGGDGFAQVDTLSALMRWTEDGEAPAQLVAERVPDRPMGGPGGPAPGGARPSEPYARAHLPALASRPVYPFPVIARYAGRGDPTAAGSFGPGPSPAGDADGADGAWAALIGPGFQRRFSVEGGTLVPARD